MGKMKATLDNIASEGANTDAPSATEGAGNVTSISAARGKGAGRAASAGDAAPRVADAAFAPAVAVFGRDDAGKPHASWFGAADAELAAKAAGLMGYSVVPITGDEHRAAALQLAAGRVFASGRGFVPFCREAAYTALESLPGAYRPPAPVEAEPVPMPAVTATPQRWEDIAVGSLVLACEQPEAGWFEAVVAEDRGEALYVLRWRDYADHDAFVRRADGLALLPTLVMAQA